MTATKRFAVTGDPVLHSKSPLIFNTLFKALSIDAVYSRAVAGRPLEALFLFRKLGLGGMNVTAPFKKSIMPFLDSVEDAAAAIGGVNTVVREKDRLRGYNTDHIGVTESLINRDLPPAGKKCVVLGAGGAGRAAVYGLVRAGADVTLMNRTHEKALSAAADLGCRAEKIEMLESRLKDADIFVSTLSADVDIIPPEWLPADLAVFDANYKQSPLSQKASANGCRVIKGEEWLLNQAIPAYRLFFAGEGADEIPAPLIESVTQALRTPGTARKSKNISLVGFMGSGKTAIGKILAEKLGFTFIDTDEQIEAAAGRSIPEIFETEGESGFRKREKTILRELLQQRDGTLFSCGGGAVLDSGNRELMQENSVVFWLYASIRTTLKRIRRGTRPLLDCESPDKKAREILTGRLPAYARAADAVISSENDADQVAEKIHEEIRKTFQN